VASSSRGIRAGRAYVELFSTANEALSVLGLTAADLADLSPERQFALIAERMSAIKNLTLKAGVSCGKRRST